MLSIMRTLYKKGERTGSMGKRQMLWQTLILIGVLLGCAGGFAGLMLSARAVLEREDSEEIFSITTTQPENGQVSLPCPVAGTELIARQLVIYEGPYLEDGGDTPVSDITALLLYNGGQREIGQAEVILTGEEELRFLASNIMPGMQILVLEKKAAPWKERRITGCEGWVREEAEEAISEEDLQFQEQDIGTVLVTNTTQTELRDIWLFYKSYLPESDLYIGGITYITTIDALLPGQSKQITPERYAGDYSRIFKAISLE